MITLTTYSGRDLRQILRLVTALLVWKLLSTDYFAFAPLQKGPIFYELALPGLNSLLEFARPTLFRSLHRIEFVQLAACACMAWGAMRLQRLPFLLGLAGALVIEWNAAQYRWHLLDVDLPLAVLLLLAAWPARWRDIFADDALPTPPSNTVGRSLFTYVGMVYFVCGLSKPLIALNWPAVAQLHMSRAMMVCNISAEFPQSLDGITRFLEVLLRQHPRLDQTAALGATLLELTWIVGLFHERSRRVLPWLMVGMHLSIALTMGVLFVPFCLTALIVAQPWRRHVTARESAMGLPWWFNVRVAAALAGAAGLALGPALFHATWPPFENYNLFGFRFADYPTTVYRLGFRDTAGEWRILPHNHGGFFDYRWATLPDPDIAGYLGAEDENQRRFYLERLWQITRAMRGDHSERWLLGKLALPLHVLTKSQPLTREDLRALHLLRGQLVDSHARNPLEWQDLGPLPRVP